VKIAFILCAVCVISTFAGCAVAESDGSEVGTQFQRGIQGQGKVVPNNPTSDSFGADYR
jgi:hypothetical protein